MKSARMRAVRKLMRAPHYVLVTPEEVIMEGQLSQDFTGFLQISSLLQVKQHIDTVIRDWEKATGREAPGPKKRGRPPKKKE